MANMAKRQDRGTLGRPPDHDHGHTEIKQTCTTWTEVFAEARRLKKLALMDVMRILSKAEVDAKKLPVYQSAITDKDIERLERIITNKHPDARAFYLGIHNTEMTRSSSDSTLVDCLTVAWSDGSEDPRQLFEAVFTFA